MEKTCTKCHLSKDIDDFRKSTLYPSGYMARCKSCINETNKAWRTANPEKFHEMRKKNYWKDPEKSRADRRRNYNPATKAPYDVVYRATHREHIAQLKRDWDKIHRHEPLVKLRRNLRRRIHHLLKDGYKSKHTEELLGCSFELFKLYIESKFQEGMSWENYGKWHLDHIKPCYEFDLTKVEEQLKCFNYSNQQPLWATDNLKKGRKHDRGGNKS